MIVGSVSSWVAFTDVQAILTRVGIDLTPWIKGVLDAMVLEQQELFQEMTGRHVESQAVVQEVYDGNGTDELVLNDYPVASVTLFDRDTSGDANHTTIDANDYDVDADRGILTKFAGILFADIKKSILVSYTRGWAITSIPRQIKSCIEKQTVLEVLSEAFMREDGQEILPSVESLSADGYNVKFDNGPHGKTIKKYWKDIKRVWTKYGWQGEKDDGA